MIRDGIVCYDCQRITSGDCGKHGPTTVTYGRTDSIPEPEGTWPADCVQRAFVAGAKWWQFVSGGSTMFPSERHQAEAEAVKRYGDPTPEPERRKPWLPETATVRRQLETLIEIGASAPVIGVAGVVLHECMERDMEEAKVEPERRCQKCGKGESEHQVTPTLWICEPERRPDRLSPAPCSKCGYNGPGYFQPDTHPCAAAHHAPERQREPSPEAVPAGHPYSTFTTPERPEVVAAWESFMVWAVIFRQHFEGLVPPCSNKREALVRLDKAVMVARGAFRVHPR